MRLSLRLRIFLTLLPLLALLLVVGGAGVALLLRLGGSIDLILKENYESVIAMERLNEALERIDSSFQFTLAGLEKKGRQQYQDHWPAYEAARRKENANVTIHPREDELVSQLDQLSRQYRKRGDAFFERAENAARHQDYFGQGGLLETFEAIKAVSGEILRINEQNMEDASHESRVLAARSVLWLAIGLAAAILLALFLTNHAVRTILHPIRAVTQSALAIGAGNLDQVVPVTSRDELGRLADAFNTMGRQLRHYRKTDYARLLRAQRTSQATIDSFPDPVLVIDTEHRVEMANPAARQLLGVAAPPSGPELQVPWQAPEPLREPLGEALRGESAYLPEGFDRAVLLRSEGKACYYLPRILPIRDPYEQTLGAAVLLQDVTRFQILDQVKSNLVATVSHELKTPLTSIRLALHLLLEEAAGPLAAKQTELLVDARDNAERLLATINNLLDLTRLEKQQGGLERKPEAPAGLLQAAAEAARPRAETKGVALDVDLPADLPPVGIDAARFGHALDNLLDNAVTYTQPGGRITVSAAAEGETVAVTIADTGPGIPEEFLPHVFERFFRVPGQRQGGTGLGLAIVREVVTAHGGAITCTSKPGTGTTFRITLPVERSDGVPALTHE